MYSSVQDKTPFADEAPMSDQSSSDDEETSSPSSTPFYAKCSRRVLGFSSLMFVFFVVAICIVFTDLNGDDGNDTDTENLIQSHEDATEEEMFQAWPWLADEGDCAPYMQSEGCGWTSQWNCPDQSGGIGKARVDGTLGYSCCCERGYWKNPPTNSSGEYWSTGDSKVITVYHQTSPQVCELIMASSFRLGKGGLCGKGIYFALAPQATRTKAITRGSHGGCMLEVSVEVGKQGFFSASDSRPNRKYKESCGRWNSMNAATLHAKGYDSVLMNRGDGDEVIVFEPERIKSKRIIPFKCSWMCAGACQKHWPQNCRR